MVKEVKNCTGGRSKTLSERFIRRRMVHFKHLVPPPEAEHPVSAGDLLQLWARIGLVQNSAGWRKKDNTTVK